MAKKKKKRKKSKYNSINKWWELGKIYFKILQIKKQIKKLQKGDKIITSEFEILQQCHDYYQKLYKKSNVCDVTQKTYYKTYQIK